MKQKITLMALGYLALVSAFVGIWALGFPHEFYGLFPGIRHNWISMDGPYNEHLIRDVGALNLGICVLSLLGLRRPTLASPFTVGLVSAVFNLPHLVYHMTHLTMFALTDQIGIVGSLGSTLCASLWLIVCRPGETNHENE